MLKDLGIKVPSSLSLDILREPVDQNHDNIRASNTNADDHEFTNCQLPGSYPSFDIESNNGDSMEQTSVNAAERIKASPRTYTLFNCPIFDCSNSPSMVEFIPQSLRKAIQEGKDVCLAHLLIPEEHSLSQYQDGIKDSTSIYLKSTDPRLHRSLSLPEFMLAFVRYLNVMTEVHPERLVELNIYLSFIVKMGVQFPPPLFYEYQKNFSHDDLYFQIFAGRRARTCDKCSSVDHSTDFRPSIFHWDIKNDVTSMSMNDSRSRIMMWQRFKRTSIFTADQREICFNYNGNRGCTNHVCQRAHVCLKCQQPHPQKDCRPVATNS
ncbi:unnamed protein product [Rotaria magnacalcarata]|uniref:Uncharacterized protein n=2 Tax=Rotaria magnacalcarata TaxID=392030 RepID=A0A814YKU7_9BILA|nr:unnamed protein product [Rotaria magnacalcarata]